MADFAPSANKIACYGLYPAGRSVVLGYTMPLWVMVGARIFLGEALAPACLVGVTMGMLGIALLFNPLSFDWRDRPAITGNSLVLLGSLCPCRPPRINPDARVRKIVTDTAAIGNAAGRTHFQALQPAYDTLFRCDIVVAHRDRLSITALCLKDVRG
jgi:drug/metabolite transporter (DMT)-like permease